MKSALAFLRNAKHGFRPCLPRSMVVSSYDLGSTVGPRHSSSSSSSSSSRSNDYSSNDKIILEPLVVCGPSGVGKGTIIQQFMQQKSTNSGSPLQFDFSVSHTTRNPRPGEQDGIHYHFVSKTEMQSLIQNENHFVEWAEVHGNYYGTSWEALLRVQENGRNSLLDIDVQGVQRLKQLQAMQPQQKQSFLFQPKYIFIAPPTLETLQDRLRARATETDEALQTRLSNAASEVAYGTWPGNFDAIVVNDQLETAVQEFETVVCKLYQQQ